MKLKANDALACHTVRFKPEVFTDEVDRDSDIDKCSCADNYVPEEFIAWAIMKEIRGK